MEDNFGFGTDAITAHTKNTTRRRVKAPLPGLLPWPDPFPAFKGLFMFTNDNDFTGHGQEVHEVEYYDFTWHPDSDQFPNIARMMNKGTIVTVCEDADKKHSVNLNKSYVWETYFIVDTARKAFRRIGANECPEQYTVKMSFGIYREPLAEPAGVWQWHEMNGINPEAEAALNAMADSITPGMPPRGNRNNMDCK